MCSEVKEAEARLCRSGIDLYMKRETQAGAGAHFADEDKGRRSVLFLLSSLTIGGSERKAVRIVNELHRTGWNVHLAYLNHPATLLNDIREGVPRVFLNRKGKISLASILRLKDYIQQTHIATIVCINLYPLIYAQAVRYLLPVNVSPRLILAVNSTKHIAVKNRLAMQIYRPLMKRADKIVFGCQVQLQHWCAQYELQTERCEVIYNGVDEERFICEITDSVAKQTIARESSDFPEFVVGTVGQLRPVKNQIELILALAHLKDRLPNMRLLIIGDGSERERLESIVEDQDLSDRVTFLGALDDVRPAVKSLNLFVLTSISETFSNAALEAMAMGKTVILSDTGGAREMIEDGINGYIYERGDRRALAALIEQLERDPEKRRTIGENARATVLAKFTFGRMISEYEYLLR